MEQALDLDAKNGNTLLADAIYKEIENVRVALENVPDGKSVPIGNQFVQCHMIFDSKMEDFQHKARLVAGGHMINTPASIMYESQVFREKVRIALMIAAPNDHEVKLGITLNAYIQAPVTEKS